MAISMVKLLEWKSTYKLIWRSNLKQPSNYFSDVSTCSDKKGRQKLIIFKGIDKLNGLTNVSKTVDPVQN